MSDSREKDKNNVEVKEKCELSLPQAPKDKFYTIYILFFLLGMVDFVPKSFFVTATDYWMYKFRNTTSDSHDSKHRTQLQAQYNASMKIAQQVTEITFMFLTIAFGRKVQLRLRVMGTLSVVAMLFLTLTVFIKIDTDSWQYDFFAIVITIVAIINASNSILTISILTLMSRFPKSCVAAFLAGFGICNLVIALLQIFSLTFQLHSLDRALIYFSIGTCFIIFTFAIFVFTSSYNKRYLFFTKATQHQEEKDLTFRDSRRLIKIIWTSPIIMGLLFFTLDVCPVPLVVSEGEGNGPWNDIYFIPTMTYLLHAIADLVGRAISFKYTFRIKEIGWTIITALRTLIFVPLFMFCNAQPRHHLPILFPHDYQYIIINAVYSLTGGYLVSFCYYNMQRLVPKEDLKNSYHLNRLCTGIFTAAFSYTNIIIVQIL